MEEKITLAVTDDHKLMRKSVIEFLTDMGFEVLIEATSGPNLLEQLKTATRLPQVCLLDYNMSGMQGYEVAAVLSKQYPSIKLAALTSENTPSCLIDMIGNGCGTYFLKNSSPAEWKQGLIELHSKGYHFTEWMQQKMLQHFQTNYKDLFFQK